MKGVKEELNKWVDRYTMFIYRKAQYCHNVSSSQFDLQVQCDPNQSPLKLLCRIIKMILRFYVEAKDPASHIDCRQTLSASALCL